MPAGPIQQWMSGWGAVPTAPVTVLSKQIGSTSYQARWAASIEGSVTYRLDVSLNIGFSSFVTGYNNLNVGNVLTYRVTGLSLGTVYYFRVRAVNAVGTSSNSDIRTFTTTATKRPIDLTNQVMWLRADNITGLSDGDLINTWTDDFLLGHNATESTSKIVPQYKAAVVNGRAVVRFADDQGMVTAGDVSSGSFTIFIVYSASALGGGRRAIAGLSNNFLIGPYNGAYQVYNGGFVGTPVTATVGPFVVERIVDDGTGLTHYTNGASAGSAGHGAFPGVMGLGARNAYSETFNGDIAEVVVVNTALTGTDVTDIENYLISEYGPITVLASPVALPILAGV